MFQIRICGCGIGYGCWFEFGDGLIVVRLCDVAWHFFEWFCVGLIDWNRFQIRIVLMVVMLFVSIGFGLWLGDEADLWLWVYGIGWCWELQVLTELCVCLIFFCRFGIERIGVFCSWKMGFWLWLKMVFSLYWCVDCVQFSVPFTACVSSLLIKILPLPLTEIKF